MKLDNSPRKRKVARPDVLAIFSDSTEEDRVVDSILSIRPKVKQVVKKTDPFSTSTSPANKVLRVSLNEKLDERKENKSKLDRSQVNNSNLGKSSIDFQRDSLMFYEKSTIDNLYASHDRKSPMGTFRAKPFDAESFKMKHNKIRKRAFEGSMQAVNRLLDVPHVQFNR